MPRKKRPTLTPGDLVLVKWLDAAGHRYKSEADPVPCLSVGWIVEFGEKDGKQYVKLASELLNDGEQFDTQEHVSIPEGMVQSITVIRTRLPQPFAGWRESHESRG